jgi:hypothetical protein
MRGHFRYLRFKTIPMTPTTLRCEVFWVLLSNSEHLGVPEDSKSPTVEVLGFTRTLGQSGVATDLESCRTSECLGFDSRGRNTSDLGVLGVIRKVFVITPLWPSVGVKPDTSKVGGWESSGTPECLWFDSKAQNALHWRVLSVIGKVLKRRY